jgi:hypothetical protein
MKKTLFKIALVIGLFSITAVSNAQDIQFGAKAGVNLANISGDFGGGDKPTMLTSFHVGAIVDIGLSDQFSIIPEVLYSMKGAKLKTTTTETDIVGGITVTTTNKNESSNKLGYIEIPILATYKLESGLHFELGPYIGLLMSAKQTGTTTSTVSMTGQPDQTEEHEFSESSTEGYASTDIGLALGLGYKLESGLGFAARYSMGMTDIFDPSGDETYKNTVIGVSVSYMFGGK